MKHDWNADELLGHWTLLPWRFAGSRVQRQNPLIRSETVFVFCEDCRETNFDLDRRLNGSCRFPRN